MFRVALALLLAASVRSAQLDFDEDAWGPSDSVHALDAVIAAVDKITNNTHLSAEHLDKAKHVAADVKADIEAVEGGNLTKQQAHERVGAAIKELVAFETVLQPQPAAGDRLALLKKRLADKKAELAKTMSLMKLLKLKEALAQKKLLLQKLLAQKAASEGGHQADEQDAAKTSALVKQLRGMAKNFTKNSSKKAALDAVQAREREVVDALAHMDAKQNKSEASLSAALGTSAPAKGKKDAIAKGMSMLKMLLNKERRMFTKARAVKQTELKELKEAAARVQQGDAAGLEGVLTKLQREGEARQATSGGFLH